MIDSLNEIISPNAELDDLPEELANVRTFTILVDGKRAEEILTRNVEPSKGVEGTNRRSSSKLIDRHAAAMDSNKWIITHQGLAIAASGKLIDGGHRLKAIIAAAAENPDLAVPMLLTINLPDEAMDVVDLGKRRTLGDTLNRLGFTDTNVLGAATRLVWAYDNHNRKEKHNGLWWHHAPDRGEVVALIQGRADLFVTAAARTAGHSLMVRSALTAGIVLITRDNNAERLEPFLEQLIDAVGLQRGEPVHSLRRLLENERTRGITVEHLAYLILTYNDFVQGRTRQVLAWSPSVSKFPILDTAK